MTVLTKKEKEALLKEFGVKEQIIKDAAISWDGANLMVRIPKEIGDFFRINDKNAFNKKIRFIVKEEGEKIIKEFDFLDRK